MQEAFNAMERAPQPVICAVHGACIGGAIDMIAAADVRFASAETLFSIKVRPPARLALAVCGC
jgi:enoyl-CoA hydratase